MMGAIHACIGAGLGALTSRKTTAFTAGVVSHAVCDIIPHKEAPAAIDIVLTGAVLGGVGTMYGVRSSELAGAVGAVLPDLEHGLVISGMIAKDDCLFPTHNKMLPHNKSDSYATQIIAAAGVLLAAFVICRKR